MYRSISTIENSTRSLATYRHSVLRYVSATRARSPPIFHKNRSAVWIEFHAIHHMPKDLPGLWDHLTTGVYTEKVNWKTTWQRGAPPKRFGGRLGQTDALGTGEE